MHSVFIIYIDEKKTQPKIVYWLCFQKIIFETSNFNSIELQYLHVKETKLNPHENFCYHMM